MDSATTNIRSKGPLNSTDFGPRFGWTKVAVAVIRGSLKSAVIFALLLIAARPAQAQSEIALYNFTGGSDGGYPMSRPTFDAAGNLYGTTNAGGLGYGTVFELSPNGSGGWNETVLYSFTGGADGANPNYSDVIFDSFGNLYGTTYNGGAYGYGVVFELSPVGASWTETVLYSFANGADGANPISGVIFDSEGNLYGRNSPGVFELRPSGGGWTAQVIYNAYSTQNDGLTIDADGNIFGTGNEAVFELSPNGNGGWNPSVIYTLPCSPSLKCPKGEWTFGILALDKAGNLYGTTYQGGPNCGVGYGCGSVYELIRGNGTWTVRDLHNFQGGPNDGYHPFGWMAVDAAGNVYGSTIFGGYPWGGCQECGEGTVFELEPTVGTGKYKEKVLQNFDGQDGFWPYSGSILDTAGNLYSTSQYGGMHSAGLVYELTASLVTTKTTLTSSPNPSIYGQPVVFTALVTPAPPSGETVSFMKGKTVLGTGTLNAGSATFTISTLKVGSTTVSAVYGGDSRFVASKSKALKQVVQNAVE